MPTATKVDLKCFQIRGRPNGEMKRLRSLDCALSINNLKDRHFEVFTVVSLTNYKKKKKKINEYNTRLIKFCSLLNIDNKDREIPALAINYSADMSLFK